MTIAPTRFGALGAAFLCSLAAAQQAGTPEALDQMIEDVNPLSTSLRNVEFGLREPNSFDQVMRIGGPDGKLMRVQGALFALFDQSVYVSDGKTFFALRSVAGRRLKSMPVPEKYTSKSGSQPETGNQPSHKPKVSTSKGPSTKLGMQIPVIANDMGT